MKPHQEWPTILDVYEEGQTVTGRKNFGPPNLGLLHPGLLELSPTVTPGAPHCPDYGQTHITRTKDVRPWLRANHLSQQSHIRVHNSHQLSDRDCYYR